MNIHTHVAKTWGRAEFSTKVKQGRETGGDVLSLVFLQYVLVKVILARM